MLVYRGDLEVMPKLSWQIGQSIKATRWPAVLGTCERAEAAFEIAEEELRSLGDLDGVAPPENFNGSGGVNEANIEDDTGTKGSW